MAENNNEGPQIPSNESFKMTQENGSGQKVKDIEVGGLKTEFIDMINKKNDENPIPKDTKIDMTGLYDSLAADYALKNKKHMDAPIETSETPDNVIKVDFQNKKKI